MAFSDPLMLGDMTTPPPPLLSEMSILSRVSSRNFVWGGRGHGNFMCISTPKQFLPPPSLSFPPSSLPPSFPLFSLFPFLSLSLGGGGGEGGAGSPPPQLDETLLSMIRFTPTIARSYLWPPHLYVASDASGSI